jgi:hypothetical protein
MMAAVEFELHHGYRSGLAPATGLHGTRDGAVPKSSYIDGTVSTLVGASHRWETLLSIDALWKSSGTWRHCRMWPER